MKSPILFFSIWLNHSIPINKIPLLGGAPPARTRAGLSPKHQAAEDVSKHQSASRPAWLLTLEIVTGTMVGVLFLVAGFTGLQRCKSKPSIIIPWKKSASEKDHIYIG